MNVTTTTDVEDLEAVRLRAPAAGIGSRERWVVAGTLLLICTLVSIDLLGDLGDGVAVWHMLLEAAAGLAALAGMFQLLRGGLRLRRRLAIEIASFSAFRAEAERWRVTSRRHVEGLSKAIDAQLTSWRLSAAEKEVAFLLLKGCGLKEIAQIRDTSEKTARAQSTAVYAKAGVAGRSQLAAFFLEDLLVPRDPPGS